MQKLRKNTKRTGFGAAKERAVLPAQRDATRYCTTVRPADAEAHLIYSYPPAHLKGRRLEKCLHSQHTDRPRRWC